MSNAWESICNIAKEVNMNHLGNLNAVDVGKFFMAIVVIAIHTRPFEGFEPSIFLQLYDLLCTCAVPFFFLATGYLLERKLKNEYSFMMRNKAVSRTLYKMIQLYLIWSIVYLPLAIYDYYFFPGKSIFGSFIVFDALSYIQGLLFVGEHFNSWILWYLLSAIYALFVVKFLVSKGKTASCLCLVGCIVFVIGIGITYLVSCTGELPKTGVLVQKLIRYTFVNGRLTTAFLYIPVGMLLYEINISKIRYVLIIIMGGILCLSPLYEIFALRYFITAMTAIGIFGIALNTDLKDSKVYLKLRTSSTVIYFMHMWVWSIYALVINHTLMPATYGLDKFLVTAIVTLAMSLIYIKWKEKHAIVLLKLLYHRRTDGPLR